MHGQWIELKRLIDHPHHVHGRDMAKVPELHRRTLERLDIAKVIKTKLARLTECANFLCGRLHPTARDARHHLSLKIRLQRREKNLQLDSMGAAELAKLADRADL